MPFNELPSVDFDPGKPVKSEHGKAFYDNPLAIAAHDDSSDPAPRVHCDATASNASAISSTAAVGSVLRVSDVDSPDGHGKLVVPEVVSEYLYAIRPIYDAGSHTSTELPFWHVGLTTRILQHIKGDNVNSALWVPSFRYNAELSNVTLWVYRLTSSAPTVTTHTIPINNSWTLVIDDAGSGSFDFGILEVKCREASGIIYIQFRGDLATSGGGIPSIANGSQSYIEEWRNG